MKTQLIAAAMLAAGMLSSGATMAADAAGPAGPNQNTVHAMFALADQNKDGLLTRQEARGHLPATYANFDRIDTARRGSISFEQFLAFTQQRVGKQADELLKIGQWH
jgi:EF-hand domain pair